MSRISLTAALTTIGITGTALVFAGTSVATAGAEFYNGKTVTYVIATSPGGGYDFYGRLTAKYMQKYLPGSTFSVKNKPGSGHKVGTNFIYNSPPDGLTIGIFNTGLIFSQVVGHKGVKFDLGKMSWIGKAASDPRVVVAARNGPKTLAELAGSTQWVFASSGIGSSGYNDTQMLGKVLGWNYKLVLGYRGDQSELAMKRGEVHVMVGSLSSASDFVKSGHGRVLAQVGGARQGDAPMLRDVVKNDKGKAIAALIGSQAELARFSAGPPVIPQDRLKALRVAYRKAMEDTELQMAVKKANRPLAPAYGDDVAKQVRAALKQPPEIVALVGKILSTKAGTNTASSTKILTKSKDGRWITFNDGGKTIKAKVSGSRTKITVGGKKVRRKGLKVGMVCNIEYKPGGKNEPKRITCS